MFRDNPRGLGQRKQKAGAGLHGGEEGCWRARLERGVGGRASILEHATSDMHGGHSGLCLLRNSWVCEPGVQEQCTFGGHRPISGTWSEKLGETPARV